VAEDLEAEVRVRVLALALGAIAVVGEVSLVECVAGDRRDRREPDGRRERPQLLRIHSGRKNHCASLDTREAANTKESWRWENSESNT
jgi:hypothetical protein